MRPITDLSDQGSMQLAVQEAMQANKERKDFAGNYGYRSSEKWIVRVDGVEIDSKPLAAAAFQYQYGEMPASFSGGSKGLRRALKNVGYELEERSGSPWSTPIGTQGTKSQFSLLYGGSTMGGIQPSARTKNVLLYSDPEVGTDFGYKYDGWTSDGETFTYTGEGRYGPQTLKDGNGAILNHRQQGRALRLFVSDGYVKGTRTKNRVYIGEFVLDDSIPYSVEDALDANKQIRTVYVFRLKPVTNALRRPKDFNHSFASPRLKGTANKIPLENHSVTSFDTAGTVPGVAEKREQALVDKFSIELLSRSHELSRWMITPPECVRPLYTDIFDETAGVLYEAKAGATRSNIRMGLGQLLDYKRYTPKSVKSFSLLLPTEPHSDLQALLVSQGLDAVWPDPQDGRFVHLTSNGLQPF